MIVLGIETSGETASIAIREDETILASRAFPSRSTLCERLAAEIGSALEHLGEDHSLDAVAVSRGPGSFTSLRIGVVTAKALAHRWRLPLVGIPTTEVVAWPFAQMEGTTIAALLPAWNTALYLAVYLSGPTGRLEERLGPCAVEPAEAIARLSAMDGPLQLVGRRALEHRGAIEEALGAQAEFATESACDPDAVSLTEIALGRVAEADPQAAFRLRPLYIVPSQAERVAGIDLGMSGETDGAYQEL
ncbi:MAG: tRNA (adenosine(37)-N6)-threonylcarbamoyltransferase complex dimerization subunit type 1 TsaB [Armatimonadetes bacterium]|nr:tRNA (adenosine(37)-N6)-threonylcarbamoyltransferase complex dimerization subunit type 1 TsaB [Armatimonadota bacterium]